VPFIEFDFEAWSFFFRVVCTVLRWLLLLHFFRSSFFLRSSLFYDMIYRYKRLFDRPVRLTSLFVAFIGVFIEFFELHGRHEDFAGIFAPREFQGRFAFGILRLSIASGIYQSLAGSRMVSP